jgi:hypothetical protein
MAEIQGLVDQAAWDSAMVKESANRDPIGEISARWSDVRRLPAAGGKGDELRAPRRNASTRARPFDRQSSTFPFSRESHRSSCSSEQGVEQR